ncbi:MAG TPA: glycosyl transferase family 1 [Rhodospirillaceae bacterium]|nr:glycosyl transferase family 1 [Rhodospirillaceae bacterium]
MGVALAWRLAWRDLKGGPGGVLRGLGIFLACLVLGVTAIAAVNSLSRSFVAGLDRDGTKLLGGDVDLRLTHRAADAAQLAYLDAHARARADTVEMRTMARPLDPQARRSLAELKAVDGAYPLAGTLVTDPARPLGEILANRDGAWGAAVDGNLLTRLGAKVGDRVRVGEAEFQIRAVIQKEPDRVASVFSFGPRFMVSLNALPATGLVQPGSQIRYHHRVMLPPGTSVPAFIEGLSEQFPDAGWRIRAADEAAPGVRRFVERLTLFMGFVGLTVLLVGGIGITNAVAGYLDQRSTTIATLKCLGAPGRLIFTIYLIQVLILAAGGVALGLVLGAVLPWLGVTAFGGLLPVAPEPGIYPAALATAAAFGMVSAVTFALWPLARAREVRAGDLFRDRVAPAGRRPRAVYLVLMALGVAALAALTVATAADRGFAYWFVGGAILFLAVLRAAAWAVGRAARAYKRPPGARLRLVVANLGRPDSMVPSVVTSLGLGLAVLVAVALIDANMTRQVSERLPEEAPAFFFLDIQPDQVAEFDTAVMGIKGAAHLQRVPSLRGRITHINGTPVDEIEIAPDSQWAIRGDRALTYAAVQPDASEITAGEWWPRDYAGPPLISLDANLAKGFGIGLGDTLSLNILGRPVTAAVASLRRIDWRSLRFDFAIIFAPGTLEGAPHSHIAAVEAPPSAEDTIERTVADRFLNVSAIRVREALEAAARIMEGVSWAVRGVAAITIAAGALVLAGTIAAGHRRRVYDAVVFKVLGARRGRVLGGYLLEYGALGLLTAVIGAAVGTAAAWGIVVHLMKSDWAFDLPAAAVTAAFCLAVTLIMGLFGTWRAMGQKAMPHLRNQ